MKNKFHTKFKLPEDKVAVWPVGIETFDNTRNITYDCLIYHKRRSDQELDQVKKFLEERNLTHLVLQYGSYDEEGFRNLANQAKFCFLINGTESQGIAVQEIMSLGVPIIAWDIKTWEDQGPEWSVPATSVPFWDERCGEKFYDVNEMEKTFDKFYATIDKYNPKEFVKDTLSFECSVKTLLEILES